MKHIIDPQTLLKKVHSTLVIDVLDHVYKLPYELLYTVPIDPTPGIYVKGQTKPILTEGALYYLESNFDNPKQYITNLEAALHMKDNIVDVHGNTIISKLELHKFKHMFTATPDIPIVAIQIAVHIVMDILNRIAPYARCSRTKHLHYLVKEQYLSLVDEDDIYEDALCDLVDEVYNFINEDTWHIYFTRIIGTTIIVEKVIDWRIYRYHELEYHKHLEEGSHLC